MLRAIYLRYGLLFFAVLLFLGYGAMHQLQSWPESPVLLAHPVHINIIKGTGLAHISRQLEEHGLVTNGQMFRYYARWRQLDQMIQATSTVNRIKS